MTLFDILFGGILWQRDEKISANNNGKKEFGGQQIYVLLESRGKRWEEKMTGKQNWCLFYFSPSPSFHSAPSLSSVPPTTFAGFI